MSSPVDPRALRLVDLVRAAALRGEVCPSNRALVAALGVASGSTVVVLIDRAQAAGLIVCERGNSARVIHAADGSWRTAGSVGRPHWRVVGKDALPPPPPKPRPKRFDDLPPATMGELVPFPLGGAPQPGPEPEPVPALPQVQRNPFAPPVARLAGGDGCKQVLGEVGSEEGWRYCDEPRRDARCPYCVEHAARNLRERVKVPPGWARATR